MKNLPVNAVDMHAVALLDVERGLIAAHVGHLSHGGSPRDDAEQEAMTSGSTWCPRVRGGAGSRPAAKPRRAYCLGVLAYCEHDLKHLSPSRTRREPMYSNEISERAGLVSSRPLPSWSCSPRHADARASQYAYSSSRWRSMVATKQLEPRSPKLPRIRSPSVRTDGRFLAKACEQRARRSRHCGSGCRCARRGDRGAVATAEVLFDDRRLERAQRLDLADGDRRC